MLKERPRLVYVVTLPATARILLKGQLAFMRRNGFDVTIIASPGPDLETVAKREGVRVVDLPMRRAMAPGADLSSLQAMVRTLSELRPHIVNASTTKAGLLGSLAARILSVPVRLYLVRGLRLETASPLTRKILGVTEQVASAAATDVIAVSESLRQAYSTGGFCPERKLRVLGSGSSNGVNVSAFERNPERVARAREIRDRLGIRSDALVLGFLGRPVAEKGMDELLGVMERLSSPKFALVVVGGSLAGDELDAAFTARARKLPGVFLVPNVEDPADYLAAFDLLVFPSYREGFPNAPLEAAASGIPTVGFDVTGVKDAIVDGQTGRIVPVHDVEALTAAIQRYAEDDRLRREHGEHARLRVVREFSNERVWELWREEYLGLCRRYGLPCPEPLTA